MFRTQQDLARTICSANDSQGNFKLRKRIGKQQALLNYCSTQSHRHEATLHHAPTLNRLSSTVLEHREIVDTPHHTPVGLMD